MYETLGIYLNDKVNNENCSGEQKEHMKHTISTKIEGYTARLNYISSRIQRKDSTSSIDLNYLRSSLVSNVFINLESTVSSV